MGTTLSHTLSLPLSVENKVKKVALCFGGCSIIYIYLFVVKPSLDKRGHESIKRRIFSHVSRMGLLISGIYLLNKKLIKKNSMSSFGIVITSSILHTFWIIYSAKSTPHDTIPITNSNWSFFTGHLGDYTKNYDDNYFDRKIEIQDNEFGKNDWPRCVAASGPNIGINVPFGGQTVSLLDPELVKYCFELKFENFEKGDLVRMPYNELLGDGIFSSDPPEWKWHRKIASRMFSMRNLKTYLFNISINYSNIVINKCKELKIIDINNISGKYTLDCFVNSAFGIDIKAIESMPKIHPFCDSFDKLVYLLNTRYLVPWWRIQKKYKHVLKSRRELDIEKCVNTINDFVYKVINDRKNTPKFNLKDESNESCDLLSLFLKHKELNDKQIRDVSMNFILAARDTTRILISWFFYEISQRPKIEEKILNDIYESEKNNKFNYENIQRQYKYLEAVLLETLRLHPPVSYLARSCIKDTKLPGSEGYIIKKGENVVIHSYVYLRNTRIWGENARKFDPNKFIEKGLNTFTPYKYPIFNISPRLCLGKQVALMEAKIFVVKFLKQFKIQSLTNQNVTYTNSILLGMKNGFKVKVSNRNKN